MKQRELKFRAWDKKENKMLPSIGITEDGTPFLMTSVYKEKLGDELRKQNASCLAFGKDEVILMQFTGLTDKNGKEIYEGDVVTCEAYQREINDVLSKDELCIVTYREGYFYPFGYNAGWRSEVYDIEVIGNLYETPDLLTPQPNP